VVTNKGEEVKHTVPGGGALVVGISKKQLVTAYPKHREIEKVQLQEKTMAKSGGEAQEGRNKARQKKTQGGGSQRGRRESNGSTDKKTTAKMAIGHPEKKESKSGEGRTKKWD